MIPSSPTMGLTFLNQRSVPKPAIWPLRHAKLANTLKPTGDSKAELIMALRFKSLASSIQSKVGTSPKIMGFKHIGNDPFMLC